MNCEISATERLRAMLNEMGVEWSEPRDGAGFVTLYHANGVLWTAIEHSSGTLVLTGVSDDGRINDLTPEQAIAATLGPRITEDTSDGWHSFKDLYHHRALLFSVIVNAHPEMSWKSKRHHDGKALDWNFIVGMDTPWGQASYHYGMDYWDLFRCKVLDKAPFYDGYTADESVERIARLGSEEYAATVGMEPSKEWKAWHASLRHDNPTNVCEAVENILYEAIDFGGDMGPNGNVWSGIDEGTVLTKNRINGWVKSIEEIAATVGVDLNTGEAIRKMLDKFSAELCNAGCVVECETREERQRLIDAVKDKYAQAIAATVGDKPKADITGLHATVNAAITGIVRNARCFSDYRTATEHIDDNGDVTAIHECVKRAATVGAGTLTAEQVRECSKGVYFEGYSDGATHRVNGIEETDWQAIADELNATLGAGTCIYVPDESGFTWWDDNDVEHYEEHSAGDECCSASCDKCGYTMMVGEEGWFDGWDEITEWWEEDGSEHKGYVLKPRFKYCPNCGRKVTE